MTKWTAWFDGALPDGVPMCGGVIRSDVLNIDNTTKVSLLNNERTTNVAEYGGLVHVLETVSLNAKPGDEVLVQGDSQLVVRQMSGEYRLKKLHLKPYLEKAKRLIFEMAQKGISVKIAWIPREQNREADRLSKGPLL